MMFSMEQAAAIVSHRQCDPDVKQTSAETMARPSPGPAPDPLRPDIPEPQRRV